jgi:hypothetical protein
LFKAATEAMSERPQDSDLVVVYKASPAVAAQVADLLTKEGIDCVITEKADPIVSLYSLVHAPLANIAVPREQAPWARSHLRKWDDACNANVGKLTKSLGTHFFRSIAVTAVAAALFCVAGILTENTIILLIAIWAAVFALLANLERIFRTPKKG